MTDDEHRRMIAALEKSEEPGYRVPGYQTERVLEYLAIPAIPAILAELQRRIEVRGLEANARADGSSGGWLRIALK